jgi:predicted nucleic acid-binding protein
LTPTSFCTPSARTLAKQKSRANSLARNPRLAPQVVNESISVCLRKLSFTREKAYAFGRTVMDQTEVLALDEATIDRAAAVATRYQLSHWDALIVASALLAGCDTLYSEDLQHGQVFDEQLTVVNPFLGS